MKKRYLGAGLSLLLSASLVLGGCSLFSDSDSGEDRYEAEETAETTGSGEEEVTESAQTEEEEEETEASAAVSGDNTYVIFVYICGADLESKQSSATLDIYEMMSDAASGRVTYVVETGGAESWDPSIDLSADELTRIEIKGEEGTIVDTEPLADMGDPETLQDFLTWGFENYSADHTGVVLWNHGGGSISGVCFDPLYDDDSLTLAELDQAFSGAGTDVDFIGFDACLMATVETAAVVQPYADYLVASEETESGSGWDYTIFNYMLSENPEITVPDLLSAVCDGMYEACKLTEEENCATLSVTDLSKLPAFLEAFDAAAGEMNEAVQDVSALNTIVSGIRKTENYGGNTPSEGYTNMVDLGGILDRVSGEVPSAAEARSLLDDMIVYQVKGVNRSEASGLSIYYPLRVGGTYEIDDFSRISASDNYTQFVAAMAGESTGTGEEDGSAGTSEYLEIEEGPGYDEDGFYTIRLTDESYNYLSSVQYALYADMNGSGELYFLGYDNDIYMDDYGYITDNFGGSWVGLPDGQLLTYYVIEEADDYDLYSAPVLLNGVKTNLRFIYDYNEEKYTLLGAYDGINSSGFSSRDLRKIEAGDEIIPYYVLYNDDTGEETYVQGSVYTAEDDTDVEILILPEGDYYYGFCLIDIYGNELDTDYACFYVDENGEVWLEE